MSKPNILVTLPKGAVYDTFFDKDLEKDLEEIGDVTWNETGKQFSVQDLAREIKDKDICITCWGSPSFEKEVLDNANKLKLIAHSAGSIRPYVTDEAYEKGIRVCSGNKVFAESVAESVIAYALASLRDIPRYATELSEGKWPDSFDNKGLLERSVGIVGYGMISEYVVDMLKIFKTPIKVYSRHIEQKVLDEKGMEKAELEDIFKACDIVSVHSGMTPENHHLITEELLRSMKDGALIINTARGAVIDEEALIRVLKSKNIYAALDVYETEPLPKDSGLLECKNAILMPHMGGPTIDRRKAVTRWIQADIKRFLEGKPLGCEISSSRATKMSTH